MIISLHYDKEDTDHHHHLMIISLHSDEEVLLGMHECQGYANQSFKGLMQMLWIEN